MTKSGYRQLFAIAGFRQMVATLVFGRLADNSLSIVLVLVVLARFDSPGLAGLASFCLLAPGKLLSPVAGAILDRLNRRNLVVGNYLLAAGLIVAIAWLDHADILGGRGLCLLVAVLGTTSPIGEVGMRALFPLALPRRAWDRANAVDSATSVTANLLGPAGAGIAVGFLGPDGAMLGIALLLALAALLGLGVREPHGDTKSVEPVLASAWRGLKYVFGSRTLRGLSLVISLLNVSGGMLVVGVPVLVERNFHQSAQVAGFVLACFGLAGLVSAIIAGRADTEGRERAFLGAGNLVIGAGTALIAFSSSLWMLVGALLVVGAGNGPCDIALFALRQRRTDPRYYARVLAISMSLNTASIPVGAVLAGTLLAAGHGTAMWLAAAALAALGVALIPAAIPAAEMGIKGATDSCRIQPLT